MVGVDDQEVDGADVPAGADRRPKREDGATDDVPLRLGDEDAGLREVDELAEQIRGTERARRHGPREGPRRSSATSRSMSVTRAARTRYSTPKVRTSQGGDRRPSTGVSDRGRTGGRGPSDRRAMDAHDASRDARPGCGRPVLHSGRRCAMIRHRFGGHLRAARARTCVAVRHAPPSAPADALGGHRREEAGLRATGGGRASHAGRRPGDSDRGRSGTAGRSGHQEENA